MPSANAANNLTRLLYIAVFAFVIISLYEDKIEQLEERQIIEQADTAADNIDFDIPQNTEQFGVVQSVLYDHQFNTKELWQQIAKIPPNKRSYFYLWSSPQQPQFIGSAMGVDHNHYFFNSFLVGFEPFKTDSVWKPLATLALRKTYMLDHKMYGANFSEVWQNSRQAYGYSRGDCEDHAIILTDWLIALGYDARVVIGDHKNEGHAWVVLFFEGKEYILEATSKQRPKGIGDFLLASLATDYKPLYQFNRQ